MDNTTTNSETGKYFELVPVSERPTERGRYWTINPNMVSVHKRDFLFYEPYNDSWSNENNDGEHPSHWLRPYVAPAASIIHELFDLLAKHKGSIVSTASLDTYNINQARASKRLWVDDNGLGFVWMPDVKDFPETVEEVEQFEKWFPLEAELPEGLKEFKPPPAAPVREGISKALKDCIACISDARGRLDPDNSKNDDFFEQSEYLLQDIAQALIDIHKAASTERGEVNFSIDEIKIIMKSFAMECITFHGLTNPEDTINAYIKKQKS